MITRVGHPTWFSRNHILSRNQLLGRLLDMSYGMAALMSGRNSPGRFGYHWLMALGTTIDLETTQHTGATM
ncbi:hypothetical protein Hamer_G020786 [Homarus americanus]|uniref:Uncharacterized protein n=1 Tax=Homarus americanus TaxID=6706 RepID=A0A8J5NAD5_HOMAM|nr:hypothetical protein Hamer_G020786 [Homarus americanus]